MFRFPSPCLFLWWVGRSGKKKKRMNTWRGLGSRVGQAAKQESLVTKSTRKRGLFDYQISKQPLKNVVLMLIKNKNITSCQLLLTKRDLASLTSESGIFLFLLFEKNGSVGRWETKHFIRMAKWVLNKKNNETISMPIHWCMLIHNINSYQDHEATESMLHLNDRCFYSCFFDN